MRTFGSMSSPSLLIVTPSEATSLLSDIIGEDEGLLRDLLACPPAHFLVRNIVRKGKIRCVAEPDQLLKRVHRRILRSVLSRIPDNGSSYCRSGRSIVDNARQHLGNGHICTFDVRDAFRSTSYHGVLRSLRRALARSGLPSLIALPITRLCTLEHSLPQGAPTSNALLDVVLRPVDDELLAAGNSRAARYSRYVDDLTVSSGCAMPWARPAVIRALAVVGLQLNHSKTRVWSPPRRPTITGIVLRDRLVLPVEYIRRVEALITQLKSTTGPPLPKDLARIRGAIAHLRQLHPQIAKRLQADLECLRG